MDKGLVLPVQFTPHYGLDRRTTPLSKWAILRFLFVSSYRTLYSPSNTCEYEYIINNIKEYQQWLKLLKNHALEKSVVLVLSTIFECMYFVYVLNCIETIREFV